MIERKWTVTLASQAKKITKRNNKKRSLPQYVLEALKALMIDLECFGPTLGLKSENWSHFSHLGQDKYHCHLLKSNCKTGLSDKHKSGACYVACWRVEDKKIKLVEVYYVGSHEKAPY